MTASETGGLGAALLFAGISVFCAAMLVSSALISGLGLGSMYGLLALGFHITHAVSSTVNFAQGSAMMLGAVLCFTFWVTFQWPLTLAVIAGLGLCAVWGAIVERVAVRPFVQRGSNTWSCSCSARIHAACQRACSRPIQLWSLASGSSSCSS